MKNDQPKQRIQFDFSPEAMRRLDELKEKTDASTKAEVVREALKLYEWFVLKLDRDCIVEIRDKDDQTTLFKMPISRFL